MFNDTFYLLLFATTGIEKKCTHTRKNPTNPSALHARFSIITRVQILSNTGFSPVSV